MQLSKRGFNARVLFTVRDPVERCWSAVRMARREASSPRESDASRMNESEDLARYYLSNRCELRTRYDKTYERVRSVFDESEVLTSLYENLSSYKQINEVTKFLGIDYVSADFDRKVNESKKSDVLDEDLKVEIASHYADVYRWAVKKFGLDAIMRAWPNARYIVR